MKAPMPAVEVKNLSKSYRRHLRKEGVRGFLEDLFKRKYETVKALQDISFTVDRGEFIAYLGPNGAGKTTTLKLLSGILNPDAGQVRVLGKDPFRRNKEFLKRIGFVMGSKSQLCWDLPAMDTFKLMQSIYDIDNKIFRSRVDLLSSTLAVTDLIRIPVRKLSLGERMKMEIICSLLHSPDVIFLDEPTIGLDLISQDAIRQYLKWYNREFHTTIMLTSHSIRDIEEMSSRLIVIHRGNIVFNGMKSMLHETYSNHRLVITDVRSEYEGIGLADRVSRIGNRMRHLVHVSKEKLLLAELERLACSEPESKSVSLEEALKVIMHD